MVPILVSLLKTIPTEILYHKIIPFVPKHGLTKNFLQEYIVKLQFYQQLQEYLHLEDVNLKRDVFLNFTRNDSYVYEKDGILMYANFCPKQKKIIDYVCILS